MTVRYDDLKTLWEIESGPGKLFLFIVCFNKAFAYGTVTSVNTLDLACKERPL